MLPHEVTHTGMVGKSECQNLKCINCLKTNFPYCIFLYGAFLSLTLIAVTNVRYVLSRGTTLHPNVKKNVN